MKRTLYYRAGFFKKCIALLALVISMGACKKNNNTIYEDFSELNVINASPGDFSINFSLDNKYHSLFFAGQNSSPVLVFTEDDLFEPPAGKAKIRFIHLTPDAPVLNLAIKGGITLISGLTFKSVSNFINIDPSVYNFELKSSASAKAEIINVPITAGKIYTIWAGGLIADTGPNALSIQVMINK